MCLYSMSFLTALMRQTNIFAFKTVTVNMFNLYSLAYQRDFRKTRLELDMV